MSDDPVKQVIDLLEASVNGDWTNAGAKPTIIERQEESSQNYKSNIEDDAIYCYSAVDGSYEQFDFDFNTDDEETVAVDMWTVGDDTTDASTQAYNLFLDARAILDDNRNDNKANTDWERIRPVSSNDLRQETLPNSGDHARMVLNVRLRRLRIA